MCQKFNLHLPCSLHHCHLILIPHTFLKFSSLPSFLNDNKACWDLLQSESPWLETLVCRKVSHKDYTHLMSKSHELSASSRCRSDSRTHVLQPGNTEITQSTRWGNYRLSLEGWLCQCESVGSTIVKWEIGTEDRGH